MVQNVNKYLWNDGTVSVEQVKKINTLIYSIRINIIILRVFALYHGIVKSVLF